MSLPCETDGARPGESGVGSSGRTENGTLGGSHKSATSHMLSCIRFKSTSVGVENHPREMRECRWRQRSGALPGLARGTCPPHSISASSAAIYSSDRR